MKTAIRSLLLLVSIIALAACSSMARSSSPTALKMENLLEKALADEFTPGREVIVSYVEIPPNTTMERHWHPGEEFHYYLEGEVEIAIDGEPSIMGTPGKVGHVPFKKMHTAITKKKSAKIVVFRVHTKGEPVRYLESGGTAEQ